MAVHEIENELNMTCIRIFAILFLYVFLCCAAGCSSAWRGRIVHLENGRAIIQPEGEGKIKSGRKLMIYRETNVIHPVTGETLDIIKDGIAETPVLRARERTITVIVDEPWFSMMEAGDLAKSVRGSVSPSTGSVHKVGTIGEINVAEKSVEMDAALSGKASPGDVLTVIKYTKTVVDPDTGNILAVAVEPVASLRVTDVSEKLRASYNLIDEKLGWIESGDTALKLTGDMLVERLWFQDPPDGFSQEWLFGRNYLHAVRQFNSGHYREAILEFNDVIQMDANYRDAGYLLGLCYANLNRHKDAAEQFEAVLSQKQDDAKTWTALAYAYLKQEEPQKAVKVYEKLANLLPGDSRVWVDMGDIYRALGDRQKAEQAYQKALEIDADNAEAQYELLRK